MNAYFKLNANYGSLKLGILTISPSSVLLGYIDAILGDLHPKWCFIFDDAV